MLRLVCHSEGQHGGQRDSATDGLTQKRRAPPFASAGQSLPHDISDGGGEERCDAVRGCSFPSQVLWRREPNSGTDDYSKDYTATLGIGKSIRDIG